MWMSLRGLALLAALSLALAACSGGGGSSSAAPPASPPSQPEPESAAPVDSKLPGADAFPICAAAGDFWPTMIAAVSGSTVWVACKEESKLVPVDA